MNSQCRRRGVGSGSVSELTRQRGPQASRPEWRTPLLGTMSLILSSKTATVGGGRGGNVPLMCRTSHLKCSSLDRAWFGTHLSPNAKTCPFQFASILVATCPRFRTLYDFCLSCLFDKPGQPSFWHWQCLDESFFWFSICFTYLRMCD